MRISPSDCLLNESRDAQGNLLQYGSYQSIHDHFRTESEGVVRCRPYGVAEDSPSDVYFFPSPLAHFNSTMKDWAIGNTLKGADEARNAEEIMHAVHAYLAYQKGVTNNKTCAQEVFEKRRGVCQDFSHLMIALCRSIGIRTRYVNGLVLGEGETHAWVEVYDKERWIGYDPTYDRVIDWGYIKIAHGRDIYDCPSNRGQFFSRTNIEEQLTIKCEMIAL